jgi:hypothetical protein
VVQLELVYLADYSTFLRGGLGSINEKMKNTTIAA